MAIKFRPEVRAAQSRNWLGTIEIASPIRRWVLVGAVAAVVVVVSGFLGWGTYTQRQSVPGALVPSDGLVSVQASRPGLIQSIQVVQGQTVAAGQPLMILGGDTASAAMGETMQAISQDLQAKRSGLLAGLETQRQLAADRAQASAGAIASLQSQKAQIDAQYAIEADRVTRKQALVERYRPLVASGVVSALSMANSEDDVLSAKSQLKALDRQRLDLQQQISAAQQALQQAPLDWAKEEQASASAVADVDRALRENETARLAVITAPSAGVVTTLLAQKGQRVNPGETLLSIMPAGSSLLAQLLVPSRAIGFVNPGSRVVIRYQAYPYQKYGQHGGTVVRISRSALSPRDIQGLTGSAPDASMYRVDVRLDGPTFISRGQAHALLPGMVLDADVLMEKRTLLEWAFEPLYGLGQTMHATPAAGSP